jgi:Alternative complex III, ActD subunit
MTDVLLAEFLHARQLKSAAQAARQRDYRLLDAFSPHHVEGLSELFVTRSSKVRVIMFLAGFGVAALAYFAGEFYTAVINYPYNSGGRPLNAWPAFMLVPFATGILGASIAGLTTFLFETGLPRLHHPLFAVEGFERASQDRFWLMLQRPHGEDDKQRAIEWLRQAGARSVREVDT